MVQQGVTLGNGSPVVFSDTLLQTNVTTMANTNVTTANDFTNTSSKGSPIIIQEGTLTT